jgi:hypothetical protein
MPRFGMQSLIVGCAFVAIWASTLTGIYEGAEDVRRSLKVLLIISSLLAAYYAEGRPRAFYLGFSGTWLLCIVAGTNLAPQFMELGRLIRSVAGFSGVINSALYDTVRTCGTLILGTIAGLVGLYLYDQSRKHVR